MNPIEEAKERLLVALDMPMLPTALATASQLSGHVGGFKVGLELCTSEGVPTVVEALSPKGELIFLDLKLKDIPHTVGNTVMVVAHKFARSVRMLTLHCDGGAAMLKAAVAAARSRSVKSPLPLLIGVTVLTSLNQEMVSNELGLKEPLNDYVVRLACLAKEAGLDGVVASPHEVPAIKRVCGKDFLAITPGVRPSWANRGDQQRVMTPAEAVQAGADYLVIGRPITEADHAEGGPIYAVERIVKEIATVI